MGFGTKMNSFATNMQNGAKSSSVSLFHIFLRLITGLILGLTLALIGQEFFGYETFGLLFVIVVVVGAITKALSTWSISKILIFDLICVLVGMLLRMYILVAP